MTLFIPPAAAIVRAILRQRKHPDVVLFAGGPAIRQDRRAVHHNGAAVRIGSSAAACEQLGEARGSEHLERRRRERG